MGTSLNFDKKLNSKKLNKATSNWKGGKSPNLKEYVSNGLLNGSKVLDVSPWNFLYAFLIFFVTFGLLISSITKLQIVQGGEMAERSARNKIRLTKVSADRGIVFDINGNKLVENVASMNLYLSLEPYITEDGGLDNKMLEESLDTLGGIVGENWKKEDTQEGVVYESISERIYSIHASSPYFSKILISTDLDNDTVIKIKARLADMPGVLIDNGNKRHYLYGEYFTHILGYTGEVSAEDIENSEVLTSGDIVGKSGLEKYYDLEFRGKDGQLAEEVDAFGKSVTKEPYLVSAPVPGNNLYLTINKEAQVKLYELLADAVTKNNAAGAAGVIQDVNSGEILAIVSYPSYDGNLFIGGISQEEYSKILENKQNPLLNRALAAQMPPGSTFKTIVAAAGLDSKAITKNTVYVSRAGYTFSNGAPFQEFRKHVYGSLTVVDALAVSSNIFFCEMIRDWDMDELVPYLERFGIGEYTNIDIPGEAKGRLPSPENKIKLANTTSPWLEPVWYPEGDSCNSVIGQGITLVTPIQMSNWMAAIANGGTLYTPHVAKKLVDGNGLEYPLEFEILEENIVSKSALEIVRKGMWETVNGSRGIVGSLSGTGVTVAAKTGTAEFGKVNEKGIYEDTHAWVGGFFPYENPKYSFSIFLEDGGMSSNASAVMREMILWMVQTGLVE